MEGEGAGGAGQKPIDFVYNFLNSGFTYSCQPCKFPFFKRIITVINRTKNSRTDQVKFVEDSQNT